MFTITAEIQHQGIEMWRGTDTVVTPMASVCKRLIDTSNIPFLRVIYGVLLNVNSLNKKHVRHRALTLAGRLTLATHILHQQILVIPN